jgi:uncharacterized phage infection (PIP) family protein YhgE
MNTVDQVKVSVDEIRKYAYRLAQTVAECEEYVNEAKRHARIEVSAELRKANEIKESHHEYREKEIARKTADLEKLTNEMADKKLVKQRQEMQLEHKKKMAELSEREKELADNEASFEKLFDEFHPKYLAMIDEHTRMAQQVTVFNSKIPQFKEGLGIVINKLDYIYKNVAPLSPGDFERERVKELADNLHKTFTEIKV